MVLKPGVNLNDSLKDKIKSKIRNALSSRHVPDEIYPIAGVPTTLIGKKLEVSVKKILSGVPLEGAVCVNTMAKLQAITISSPVDRASLP